MLCAKAHGRQIRLERERAGYFEVTFGSASNPPFVDALWRRERVLFWAFALGFALAAIAVRLAVTRDDGLAALGVLLWAPSASFVVTGLLGLARAPAAGVWASLAWWAAAIGAFAASVFLGATARA